MKTAFPIIGVWNNRLGNVSLNSGFFHNISVHLRSGLMSLHLFFTTLRARPEGEKWKSSTLQRDQLPAAQASSFQRSY